MIDGFKFKISNQVAVTSLLNHSKLHFVGYYELRSGIVRDYKLTARYKGLKFEYYGSVIYIYGNLYEYWTGLKNYQNFKREEAVKALIQLEEDLGIVLSIVEVIKLELGVNVYLPPNISAAGLIESVLVYKGRVPSHIYYKNSGLMRQFKLSEFDIKIYDKGNQHGKGNHYLRYEIVIKKKQNLARKGINYASDLLNKSKLLKINDELINTVDHLIFYDHEIPNYKLTSKQKEFFLENNSASSWNKLMKEKPALYRKRKPSFRKTIKNITGNDWSEWLKEAVRKESHLLFLEY
jgi:hypothetical protein